MEKDSEKINELFYSLIFMREQREEVSSFLISLLEREKINWLETSDYFLACIILLISFTRGCNSDFCSVLWSVKTEKPRVAGLGRIRIRS